MGFMIGDVTKYGKTVIRLTSCWRCEHKGKWDSGQKKMWCKKTRHYGDAKRACFCKQFDSNSDSYKDPYKKEV